MKYDKKLIGKRIEELRIKRKELFFKDPNTYEKYFSCKTQALFSDAINVDRRTFLKWEKGESIPSLCTLIKICDELDCNIEYFLGADELPYIDTVSKASHFTGINPEIIEKAKTCPDFLDCLNFFMLPENCLELFNKVTLSAWREYWINQNLIDIKSPLIDIIEKAFDVFYSSTPLFELCKDKYKEYLVKYLPNDKICFENPAKNDSLIYPQKSLSTSTYIAYKKYAKNKSSTNEYENFIEYLTDLTYEPLTNREFIEIQKQKVANAFIEIVTRYLKHIQQD